MRVYVCVTCRGADDAPDSPRAGRKLFDALVAMVDPGFEPVAVECLSVCKRPCTVSFAAPGKWTYVYGDLAPDTAAAIVRDAAHLYADAPDGLIPWKQRPDAIKKGVVARIPPFAITEIPQP